MADDEIIDAVRGAVTGSGHPESEANRAADFVRDLARRTREAAKGLDFPTTRDSVVTKGTNQPGTVDENGHLRSLAQPIPSPGRSPVLVPHAISHSNISDEYRDRLAEALSAALRSELQIANPGCNIENARELIPYPLLFQLAQDSIPYFTDGEYHDTEFFDSEGNQRPEAVAKAARFIASGEYARNDAFYQQLERDPERKLFQREQLLHSDVNEVTAAARQFIDQHEGSILVVAKRDNTKEYHEVEGLKPEQLQTLIQRNFDSKALAFVHPDAEAVAIQRKPARKFAPTPACPTK